ncbi:adult-specific cuticular protein ACP-20-like [Lutzomyia longipalpis]|uniref:Putative adult-specific cuticular protein acp-20 n=1 Tax=Lutzomyia longipalpis TaxID=7200 RepID=A0A7G3AAU0_LUTLO|nr:adult-specific cuticular protein ACP-20-like [Lutzomyia longipalpis]
MHSYQVVCCLVLLAVAVSAFPGHAESYAHFNQHVDHHHGGYDHHYDHYDDHHAPANYKFGYAVKDPHTGDHKEAWEHSDGHHVTGSYSLYEPDGTKRVVDYTADPHTGFHAVVKKIGHAVHHYVPHHHEYHGHY